jgi:hypothetical protein
MDGIVGARDKLLLPLRSIPAPGSPIIMALVSSKYATTCNLL